MVRTVPLHCLLSMPNRGAWHNLLGVAVTERLCLAQENTTPRSHLDTQHCQEAAAGRYRGASSSRASRLLAAVLHSL